MERLVILVRERDNVAVALRDISAGSAVVLPDGRQIVAATNVPESHKMAIVALGAGAAVIKYGEVIGQAAKDIAQGEWVHTHNLT